MTDREIFERVRAHLLKQNAKAVSPGSSTCRYRGDGGLKCAVGCLIADEFYSETMEGAAVPPVVDGKWVTMKGFADCSALASALTQSGIPARGSTAYMLDELQSMHDSRPPHQWMGALDSMAVQFTAEGEYKP